MICTKNTSNSVNLVSRCLSKEDPAIGNLQVIYLLGHENQTTQGPLSIATALTKFHLL